MQPDGLWPNFYAGVVAYRLGHYQDAALALNACVALAPRNPCCYYNRAAALAKLHRNDQAIGDYTRALELDPDLAAAALNRGILHLQAGAYARASDDLLYALRRGADGAAVHFNLALVERARGDRAAALTNLRSALLHNPRHADALDLFRRLQH
jgi:tetratricopeptide (TPR) repeat protein